MKQVSSNAEKSGTVRDKSESIRKSEPTKTEIELSPEAQKIKRSKVKKAYDEVKNNYYPVSENIFGEKKKSKEAEKMRETLLAMRAAEHDLQAADQQSEAMEKQAKTEAAIMKIMQRISNGDKVPVEDERALMEYDIEMYQMAKMTAQMRENSKPQEYDSALEDDDTDVETMSEESMEYETASVEIEVADEENMQ